MKKTVALIVLMLCSLYAVAQIQDLQLAQQFETNGEPKKAVDIYQKLYKQNNEIYYPFYIKSLLSLKKFDEAESITKKMLNRYPQRYQYAIALGNIFREKGEPDKAENIYNNIFKNMQPDIAAIADIATGFYQAGNIDYAIKTFRQGRKILNNDQLYANELITLYGFKHDKFSVVTEYLNLLQTNPEYLAQAKIGIAAQFGDDDQDYDMLKTALLKLIQQYPQQLAYTDLLTWQYLQQKQFDQALNQALALSRRINDGGRSIFELCRTFTNNEAYDEAIRGYEFLINKGKEQEFYIPAKIELINTKNSKITAGKYILSDLTGLEKNYQDLLTEFGRNTNTAFAMQKLASLQAFKLHKLSTAEKLLEETITIPGIRPALLADCKLDLGDVYLLNNKPWDATLVYSQVEKDFSGTAVGQEAQFRNAKLAYYTGDFVWAQGQLDVLKAATSQLIANDALNLSLLINDHTAFDSTGNPLKMYARADLLIFKEDLDKAIITLDSIDRVFPGNSLSADILMSKARIFIQKKEYQLAIEPLQKIATDYKVDLWADDAVFMLGDIYENHLNDKTQAKIYYQKIITDYPSSLWLTESRKRFRILRGDILPGS